MYVSAEYPKVLYRVPLQPGSPAQPVKANRHETDGPEWQTAMWIQLKALKFAQS
jgi:hypothetical protein